MSDDTIPTSTNPAPTTAESQANAIRQAISDILGGVLDGSAERYRYQGYVRWGRVERDMWEAVDAALGVVRAGGENLQQQETAS